MLTVREVGWLQSHKWFSYNTPNFWENNVKVRLISEHYIQAELIYIFKKQTNKNPSYRASC